MELFNKTATGFRRLPRTRPRFAGMTGLFLNYDAASILVDPAVVILEPNDVILSEIVALLNFDKS